MIYDMRVYLIGAGGVKYLECAAVQKSRGGSVTTVATY